MSWRRSFDDVLSWSCKFCRVGPGNSTHRCGVTVSPKEMVIKWWTGPIERERRFHARNILRASVVVQEPKTKVTVHILTSPDSNGDSEYKQYDMTEFKDLETTETFAAAVNAIAFSCRPLSGRALVFVNPVSGSKLGPKRFKAVQHLFQLVGVEVEAVTTTHHGHASEVVSSLSADEYCAIISVSGDGTINEIYTALIARGDAECLTIPVGIIPAGSEGTLAKMSTFFNPFAAAYVILKSHEVRPLDVLSIVQGDITMYAVCGLGWGIPGKVAEESEVLRETYGRSRYAVSAIKEFVNWKGASGVLEVLPAKERPLCTCGPGGSGAPGAVAGEDSRLVVVARVRRVPGLHRRRAFRGGGRGAGGGGRRAGGGGRRAGANGAPDTAAGARLRAEEEEAAAGEAEDLSMETGECPFCHTTFCTALEGVPQPCPKCGLRPDSRPNSDNLEVLRHISGFEEKNSPPPSVVAHRRQVSEPVVQGAAVPTAVGGSGVIAIRGQTRTEDHGEEDVVDLDYETRRQGLGDHSDRGSALLHLAQRWREEEEEASARRKGHGGAAGEDDSQSKKKRGVWQRLEGSFLAVGCLNTEKISTPFVHMSDGCMDIIAVPAKVGRMELLSLGVTQLPSGGHLQDKRLFHWKATEMKFYPADSADKFNVDGEVLDGLAISVKVLPSLARLISATAET